MICNASAQPSNSRVAGTKWSREELSTAITLLKSRTLEETADMLGANRKALTAALLRAGLRARDAREGRSYSQLRAASSTPPTAFLDAHYAADALEALPANACKWPIGEPNSPDFRFCGAPRGNHPSYCECHAGLAHDYQPLANLENILLWSRKK